MAKIAPLIPENPIQTVSTGWQDAVLICRKCTRKLNGGFGAKGKATLRQVLRGLLIDSGRRGQAGFIETACMGLCPKRAIVMARASQPDRLKIVAAGTPSDQLEALLQ